MNTNPLNSNHRRNLERGQAACSECLIEIERARDAGVDLGEIPEIRDYVDNRIREILRVYFPDFERPRR